MTSILKSSKYAASAALGEPLLPAKQSRYTDSLSSFESGSSFLESDDSDDDESGDSGTLDPTKMSGKDIAISVALGLLVTGGMAASASAIVAAQSAVVILMGGVCLGM